MKPSDLVDTYPTVFHVTRPEAWPSIQRHGLLSTTALLDLFEIDGSRRHSLERSRRSAGALIEHPEHGQAWLRDNAPIIEARLPDLLEDITPEEYFALLNRNVFFWPTRQRLRRLLTATRYASGPQLVLEVRTADLLEHHSDRITLSPYNTGATIFNAPSRGSQTLKAIATYPFDDWASKRRSRRKAVTEIAVDYAVPDVAEFLVSADVHRPDDSQ